ncbi:EAL domain-containing protein [Vibrio cholerae]|uniref:EAL domain-containing protein n=1 Tax=Vibrio cholerae TaxID=666 RepID=UPI0011DAC16E|nr:EAL domain-containing protein [Vibrio cholerae]TXX84630.1 EAL domain-containing protein [Vibrio cholerae]GHY54092.1 diguanylate phosphodiesterase [Vibrio cholerae]GIA62329.1 diguanylate phosphodiesterase [Vibrio cholerae]
MLSAFIHSFRLQPILKLTDFGCVESHAFEVLSTPYTSVDSIELFFSSLPTSLTRGLVNLQIELFSRMDGVYFINLPCSLLIDEEFIENAFFYNLININLEISDPNNLFSLSNKKLNALKINIKFLQSLGAKVWIDDIDEKYLDIALYLGVNGVKLDKNFVWNSQLLDDVVCDFRQLGITVVAEGIENTTVLMKAINSRVDLVQGFFWPGINMSLDGSLLKI